MLGMSEHPNGQPPPPVTTDTTAPFGFTFGESHTQKSWSDFRRLTWPQLVEMMTSHVPGPKDGSCIVPARFSGVRRIKEEATRIDVAFLDSDAGMTLPEIEAAVIRNGWEAVISSTHSHMSTRTKVKLSNWDKFFEKNPNGTPEQFLVEDKGYLPRIAADAMAAETTSEYVFIDHQPCPKFRVAIPLERPWLAANYDSQAEANAAWKGRIEALAGALGLAHDQACTDTSRLFYLPRRPPNGVVPETAVVAGAHCDIFALKTNEPDDLLSTAGHQPKPRQTEQFRETEYLDPISGEIIDLVAWAKAHGGRFLIAKALRKNKPGALTGHSPEGKVHIDCPNAAAHTDPGRDGATYVVNGGNGTTKGFVIHCRHAHCTDKDRLFFVRRMLDEGWLRAEDLTDLTMLGGEASVEEHAGAPPAEPFIDGFDLTEDGIAQAFTKRHETNLRYCHDTGAWFEWNGKRWAEDRTRRAFSWARLICREFAEDTTAGRKATLAKVATASAIEKFAQADQALVATAETWDANPFLLGTPDGTVDLRTGKLSDPNQHDYITKQTAIAPAGTAACPIWKAFLASCTNNDLCLIRFLQQWAGYMLTGDTREHALLFIFGPGGNGKSVFLNTLSGR